MEQIEQVNKDIVTSIQNYYYFLKKKFGKRWASRDLGYYANIHGVV